MTRQDNEMEWLRLGYPEGMGSAKFPLLPPDPNFVRAYYLTTSEYGMSSISLRRRNYLRCVVRAAGNLSPVRDGMFIDAGLY